MDQYTASPFIQPKPEGRRLLTVADLAALLNVSRWAIYEWRGKGWGPPAIKINRAVRYSPEAVADWIAARAEEPRP